MKMFRRMTCALLTALTVLSLLFLFSIGSAQERASLPLETSLLPKFQELALAPRAQKNRDTCSLFAITALAEFELARSTPNSHQRLSEEFLVWAANESTGLKGDQAMFYEAAHALNALGICPQQLMPYRDAIGADRKPSNTALTSARSLSGRWQVQWIKRWDLKRPLSDSEMLAIKAALAGGHPVACGLRWPKNLTSHELIDVPPPDRVFDGHSIVLVGYQDDPQVRNDGRGRFIFRNSLGPRWGKGGYGAISYDYVRTYANDALWLKLGPPESEIPVERFEAERLNVQQRERCQTAPQQLVQWGGGMWSQGKQLFCNAETNGFVELDFTVGKADVYRVRVLATAAPDFGKIRIAIDRDSASPEFDLYSGRVSPSGSLELGNRKLDAGKHSIRFTVVGKNRMSTNYLFGIDAIDLIVAD